MLEDSPPQMKSKLAADLESETDSNLDGSVTSPYSTGEAQIDSFQSAMPNSVITSRAEGASSSGGYTVSVVLSRRKLPVYLSRFTTLK